MSKDNKIKMARKIVLFKNVVSDILIKAYSQEQFRSIVKEVYSEIFKRRKNDNSRINK
jgi:hypothetical protein